MSAEFKFRCPNCGQKIQCGDEWSGQQLKCPVCQTPMLLPAYAAAPQPARVPPPPSPKPPASPPAPKRARGFGKAILIAAIVGLACWWGIKRSYLVPMFTARARAQEINCRNRLETIHLGFRIFATDGDDRLPAASKWCDELLPSVAGGTGFESDPRRAFLCPAGDPTHRSHFALNARLSRLDIDKIHPQTILVFESSGGWNRSGGPELLCAKARHNGKHLVLFADGKIASLTAAQLQTQRWQP